MENDLLETIDELWRLIAGELSTAWFDQPLSIWARSEVVRSVSCESIGIDTAMGQIV